MNKEINEKLWVLKFCVKVVYPKYNFYLFTIFLVLKYRFWCETKLRGAMESFNVKSFPSYYINAVLQNNMPDNLNVLKNKCILISKTQYLQMVAENFFYADNGVLWLAMKLSRGFKENYKRKKHTNQGIGFEFDYITSKIHKKLWSSNKTGLGNVRIVPVVGCNLVFDNVALMTENEFYNITSSFGLSNTENYEISFQSVPSLSYVPKIATIAEVSLVLNEYDLTNVFTKEILNNYFETPKLVCLNDCFSITLHPKITSKYHYKYLDLVQSNGKVYFKCTMLSGDVQQDQTSSDKEQVIQPLYIVKGVTQLTLRDGIHTLKPKEKYFNYQNSTYLLQQCPTGLREKFSQLQESIGPFLSGKMNDISSYMMNPIIPLLLLKGAPGSGRHLLVKTLAKYNGINYLPIDCNSQQSTTSKQSEGKIFSTIQKAKAAAPVIVLLDHFEVFAVDTENNEDCRIMDFFMNKLIDLYQNYTKHPIIFVAVTDKQDLKPNIQRMFLEKFHIPKLNVKQRCELLEWFSSAMKLKIDGNYLIDQNCKVDLESDSFICKSSKNVLERVAAKTETFGYGDLDTLLHFAMRESYMKQHNSYNQLAPDPDLQLVKEEDFNSALESIRNLQSQHLDAPKIPKVYWEDIGGLEKLKKELLKTIEFPIKYPHLFKNSSLKRSGILLYGPPGCGKTLVAKAVSTELNVSFLSVKGPELLNMYVGQSEENVRKVFESARASSPCIVFLDELDALAPRRGAAGDSAGASDRVVSQLLAEIDGVTNEEEGDSSFVFIMGATNRPDLLEQSLLRPGRLDKLIYVGPYSGLYEKTSVLKALCRKEKLRPEVHLESVAAALPDRCTGADLLQVVSTARSAAVRALVDKLNKGLVKESDLSVDSVVIGVSELWHGVELFRPSVTEEELAYYESIDSKM